MRQNWNTHVIQEHCLKHFRAGVVFTLWSRSAAAAVGGVLGGPAANFRLITSLLTGTQLGRLLLLLMALIYLVPGSLKYSSHVTNVNKILYSTEQLFICVVYINLSKHSHSEKKSPVRMLGKYGTEYLVFSKAFGLFHSSLNVQKTINGWCN